jgi:hypothetical protein
MIADRPSQLLSERAASASVLHPQVVFVVQNRLPSHFFHYVTMTQFFLYASL